MKPIFDFQLHILPGRCPRNFEFIHFHNEVYQFWQTFWNDVFRQNGSSSKADANIFYRQDFVAVITCKRDIVGTIFQTENNLCSDVIRDIAYFDRPVIREICSEWKQQGLHNVSTYEMLTVNRNYRKKEMGVSFGSILLGITAKAFQATGNPVMVGPVRLDNGVNKLVEEFGWKLISDTYVMHDTPVAVSALFREAISPSPDPTIQNWINTLWNNRMDLRQPHLRKNSNLEIAA
jgi:hypothetical protein